MHVREIFAPSEPAYSLKAERQVLEADERPNNDTTIGKSARDKVDNGTEFSSRSSQEHSRWHLGLFLQAFRSLSLDDLNVVLD